ncbi:hypothetical protein GCM10011609_64010 [Lentzea pudingi]|uniref:SMP-30/Gluconolactonase/LRE-like region domain-containing protein n=2 Tax=Lentzea pudingi TaxID=1789439 RepID=A0ABQ2INA3_9PSEU|nr:hypothetical protein GCM10011609_64010 [Lentzea pudingi]
MYLADSARGVVHRFDVDRDGELGSRRVSVHTPHHTPDGMTTDGAGNLWGAFWGASVVRRYRPDGRLDREVPLPVHQRLPRRPGPEPAVRHHREVRPVPALAARWRVVRDRRRRTRLSGRRIRPAVAFLIGVER